MKFPHAGKKLSEKSRPGGLTVIETDCADMTQLPKW